MRLACFLFTRLLSKKAIESPSFAIFLLEKKGQGVPLALLSTGRFLLKKKIALFAYPFKESKKRVLMVSKKASKESKKCMFILSLTPSRGLVFFQRKQAIPPFSKEAHAVLSLKKQEGRYFKDSK